jgi:predicted ester cyclase
MTPAETVVAFHEALNGHDDAAFDHVAEDLIQHAAGPQGRDGLRETLATLEHDLDRPTATIHRVVAEDDLVVVQLTMNGRRVASTMPLLAGEQALAAAGHDGVDHEPHLIDQVVRQQRPPTRP